jgi:membrane protease subunit HflC
MKLSLLTRIAFAAVILLTLLGFMLGFQVRQNEAVVLTRFGQPVRVIQDPGLYLKWPTPIDKVNRLDARMNFFDARISEALTRDKRNVIIPVFVAWKISDPLKFLEALGSTENAQNKLDSLIVSASNTVLGGYDFNQLVSVNPAEVKLGEIEEKIVEATAPQAKNSFGVQIVQVGVKELTLPEVNTRFVFDRMIAERSQFAEQYRAEGRQQADQITATTDGEVTVMLAQAQKEAAETNGKAAAEVARIYSAAQGTDPDFYKFLRELEVLKKVVNANTTLVIDANSPPFDLLKAAPAAPLPAAPPASTAQP